MAWHGEFHPHSHSGVDFDAYNNTPMFRYNAYFGIHTVYYVDLIAHTGKQPLAMGAIIGGNKNHACQTVFTKKGAPVMNPGRWRYSTSWIT